MRKMRILNLYAGIGGNRKLWGDEHMITAVEIDPEIAKIYRDHFPNDKMVVGDAHEYLLEHFEEFDFVWSSPPCPTHSRARKMGTWKTNERHGKPYRQNLPVYPDMKLYEEILLLKEYFDGKYCVENVIAFYEPLIQPREIASHWFWTNFHITGTHSENRAHHETIEGLQERKGFDLSKYSGVDKKVLLRNCTEPELAQHILQCAFEPETKMLFTL